GAVREGGVARAVARVQPLRRRTEPPAGSDLFAGGFRLGVGDVRPGEAAGDRAGPARRIEAVVARVGVVAGRLVREHRDAGAGQVDELVVGGAVRRGVELVDLAVAVVVHAVAGLGTGRLRRAVAAMVAVGRHAVVADPHAVRVRAGARADRAGLSDLERL